MKRALIIFAKLPRAGEVKTRLGMSIGMEQAAGVYQQFAEHAFALAESVDVVNVYLFYAPDATVQEISAWVNRPFILAEQYGATLGDRMKNAFKKTFAEGAEQTIIIGTDVPELHSDVLRSAFESLSTHDIVVGPSTDGGYYLLGMKSPVKNLFEGIEWSTRYVFSQTVDRLKSQRLSFALLPEFADVDTEEDYNAFLSRRKT